MFHVFLKWNCILLSTITSVHWWSAPLLKGKLHSQSLALACFAELTFPEAAALNLQSFFFLISRSNPWYWDSWMSTEIQVSVPYTIMQMILFPWHVFIFTDLILTPNASTCSNPSASFGISHKHSPFYSQLFHWMVLLTASLSGIWLCWTHCFSVTPWMEPFFCAAHNPSIFPTTYRYLKTISSSSSLKTLTFYSFNTIDNF